MNRWKVWAAFLSPNGILTKSNSPNGVVMAVFGMSAGATGICSLEKIVAPCSAEEKS